MVGIRNWRSRLFCFVGSLFLCTPLLALGPDRSIQQFIHASWTAKDGAPSIVEALAQTNDGFLWLGTPDGPYRFDGATFERFECPSWSAFPALDVRSLFVARNGDLWIGFRFGGVSVIRNRRITNYTAADGVPAAPVIGFAQDRQGTVWTATTAGVARLEGSQWKELGKEWNFPGKGAYGIFVDSYGILWVATENTIVFLPAGTREFKPTGVHVGQVSQITQAANGKLWMAETSRSVRPVPLDTELFPPDDTEVHIGSAAILFDGDGALWITSLGDGLRRAPAPAMLRRKVGEVGAAIESFTSRDGLSDDFVSAILQDHEGNIWVGTHKGLDRFRKTNVVPVALPFPAVHTVLAAGDNGDIWATSNNRLTRIR